MRGGVEDLKRHWNLVREEHRKLVQGEMDDVIRLDDKEALEKSKIKENLDLMVHILVNEDRSIRRRMSAGSYEAAVASASTTTMGDVHSGPLKPCLEYVLENRVWETMCAIGLADRPSGMMNLVLQKLCYMLKHIRHPLLPYKRAHMPLFQMVRVCVDVGTARVNASLVDLLHTVWMKVRQDPSQLMFFLTEPSRTKAPEILLFTALLPFAQSPSKTGAKAREAILCVAGLGDSRLSEYVANHTLLCHDIVEGISAAFLSLLSCPSDPFQEDGSEVVKGAVSGELLRVLLRRLVYCNALCLSSFVMETNYVALKVDGEEATPSPSRGAGEAPRTPQEKRRMIMRRVKSDPVIIVRSLDETEDDPITLKMVSSIRKSFLADIIDGALRSNKENVAVRATNCLCAILSCLGEKELALESPLLRAIVMYIIGDGDVPESKESASSDVSMRSLLIERMKSPSETLAQATIRLFATLLDLNFPYVLHNLVLRNIALGSHLRLADAPPNTVFSKYQKVMSSFLEMFPNSPCAAARSKGATSEVADYASMQAYLTDGRRTTAHRIAAYSSLTSQRQTPTSARSATPASPRTPVSALSPDSNVAAFYEGHFLSVLYDKLEAMLITPLQENLLVTGIFSKLLQHPHDALHAYLMNLPIPSLRFEATVASPASPSKGKLEEPSTSWLVQRENVRSLSKSLDALWTEAQTRQATVNNFDANMKRVMEHMGVLPGMPGAAMSDDAEDEEFAYPLDGFFEAYIVLAEFIKEVACILQARDDLVGLRHRLDEKVVL